MDILPSTAPKILTSDTTFSNYLLIFGAYSKIPKLLAGDTGNAWEDIKLRIDPEPFSTSCQISSINKKARSENSLKPKAPFK